ncbi:MAG: NERD domain-containing protein [Campylobacteraceae bacterium]|nr:NERD domain-containing protein [Campylobacteraceae bacterium]
MSLIKADLKEWYMYVSAPKVLEDEAVQAGRDGEDFLQALLKKHFNGSFLKKERAKFYSGKRIPRSDSSGRYEADLIVLTQRFIYLIEIKNWSGVLVPFSKYREEEKESIRTQSKEYLQKLSDDDLWLQVKSYYAKGGIEKTEYVLHEDMLKLNSKKREALIAYLKNSGIKIDERKVIHKVVFVNDKFRIHESMENENLITYSEIFSFIQGAGRSGFVEGVIKGLISLLVSQENARIISEIWYQSLDPKTFDELDKCISSLRTWDYVKLNGGRILAGDCYYISDVDMESEFLTQKGEKITLPHKYFKENYIDDDTNMKTVFLFDKLNQNDMIEFEWCRSRFRGLFKAIFSKRLRGNHPFKGRSYIKFHQVGEPKVGFIELCKIDALLKG